MPLEPIEPHPGLRIAADPNKTPGIGVYHLRLTHHSGQLLALFEYVDDALCVADLIADFTDWTRTAEEILADPSINAADFCARLEGTPAVIPRPPKARDE
ncbi:hypothetical protein OG301_38880 (plasmid) [Streptomyces platensis]|uniref:hypothetical protein n=1 Tax=Streptomyces platensis TaxID=58346 RepID=UPI002ED06380|nr:hypothetical protein OG301_38880 [Streptomyces platensis]